jgi:hypothetical protein
VIPELVPLGGHLFKSSLSQEAEDRLREAAASARAGGAPAASASAGTAAGRAAG